ncbi:MAG: EamA family transporter [Bacteroidetes bacterium]|nr:EamA family transporter [Bacteroidota bacterium]
MRDFIMTSKLLSKIPAHRKGLVLISIAAFFWSTGGLFIKVLKTLDAFQISFYRSLIAAISIVIISAARKQAVKYSFDLISILCFVTFAGILILFVAATKLTTAANAIFLQFGAPIYLVISEPLIFKTKFDKRNIITVLVVIFGMALFFVGKIELGNIYGNLLAILSGMCFAAFTLFLKWKKQKHNSENTISNVVMGNFLVAAICFPIIFPNFSLDFTQAMILVFLGAVQIGISYMIFNEGIKYVSATESMIIGTLEAIFNPIWVFFGVGEKPSVFSIAGAAVILCAILWRNLISKPKDKVMPVD